MSLCGMPKSPFFDTHSTADFFLGNFEASLEPSSQEPPQVVYFRITPLALLHSLVEVYPGQPGATELRSVMSRGL
jgi:hypothetical protein